jgi:hypothetical protein
MATMKQTSSGGGLKHRLDRMGVGSVSGAIIVMLVVVVFEAKVVIKLADWLDIRGGSLGRFWVKIL